MDFLLSAITGQRLQSLTNPQPAQDTPGGKLMSEQPVRIQYARPGTSGTAYVLCAAPGNTIKFGFKRPGHYADTVFDVYTDAFTAPTDPTAAGAYYTGTLLIDGDALRALFPVAADGTSPDFVPLMGEVLSGGLPSANIPFSAGNNIIKGTESPARAVAGASGFPDASAFAAAPIQPFTAFLANDYKCQLVGAQSNTANDYQNLLDLRDQFITSIDPAYLTAILNTNRYLGAGPFTIFLSNLLGSGNRLATAALDSIISTVAAWCVVNNAGINLDVSGVGNGSPSGNAAHQDATVTIQLPTPVPAHAGLVYSIGNASGNIIVNYDSSLALAASTATITGSNITYIIGVQDSPSMADTVARINALSAENGGPAGGYINGQNDNGQLDDTGEFVGSDSVEVDYPISATGPAVVSSNPGVVAAHSADITTIENNGGSVTYNP